MCGLLTGCTYTEADYYLEMAKTQYGQTITRLNGCLANTRTILPRSQIATVYAVDEDADQAKFSNYAKLTPSQAEALIYFETGAADCYEKFRVETGRINPAFDNVIVRYWAKRTDIVQQAAAGQTTWAVLNQTVAQLNAQLKVDMDITARSIRRVTVRVPEQRGPHIPY